MLLLQRCNHACFSFNGAITHASPSTVQSRMLLLQRCNHACFSFNGAADNSSTGFIEPNRIRKRMSYAVFSVAAQISGHPKDEASSIIPAETGARAVARLLGTLVTLAAAARSSGGTIAIT